LEKRFIGHFLLFLGGGVAYLKKHWIKVLLILIMLSSLGLMVFSSLSDSMVVDEKVHISAGYLHVWKGNYTFNPEHPPLLNDLAGLFAKIAKPNLPNVDLSLFKGDDQWQYGGKLFYESNNNVDSLLFWARFPFILLTLGIIYLSYLWAKTIFNPKAGIVAAALVGFCPNILAHGHLATTDIGLVFFLLLACWLLRNYLLKASFERAILLGLLIGLVILAKFSGIIIIPIVIIGLIWLWIFRRPKILSALGQLAIIVILPIAMVWLVYAFSMRSDLALLPKKYQLSSSLGSYGITSNIAKTLLVPFDKYFIGYNLVADHNAVGHWNFLNGQIKFDGWWYYFPLALLYKLPIPTLILLALAVIFNRPKIRELFFLLLPALLFLGVAMTSRIDIGIRHILVILPFFYIYVAGLWQSKNIYLKPVISILLLATIIIGILAAPNYIAYFNQIAGGAKGGYKHLIDSNLDWNQNIKRFAKYAKENNIRYIYQYCWDGSSFAYYGIENQLLPTTPINGVVAICAHQYWIKYDYDFSWVEKHWPPDDIISNGVYVWRFDKKNVQ